MNARTEYERGVVIDITDAFLRPGMPRPIPRMSDADRNEEWVLQAQMEHAIRTMRQAIAAVNERSTVGVKIDGLAFEAFVHDEIISDRSWDERISTGIK